jgi:hypothetical protein
MSRIPLAIACLSSLPLIACGSGSGNVPETRPCEEVYVVGAVLTKDNDGLCLDADGGLTVLGYAEVECSDGSLIAYNDYAFWRPESRVVVALFPESDFTTESIEEACSL